MMQRKSKTIIFLSVLAVIIVAVPITFYGVMNAHTGIDVTSTNTVTNETFAVNFTRYTDTSICFNPNFENFTSVTQIDQNGSNHSTLVITGIISEFNDAGADDNTVGINFTVMGNFSSDIIPGGLSLTKEGYNFSGNNSFTDGIGGNSYQGDVNTTEPVHTSTYTGSFTNHTYVTLSRKSDYVSNFRYHFTFVGLLVMDIYPYYIHLSPFNITIQAALSGYSSNVIDTVNFHVMDVS